MDRQVRWAKLHGVAEESDTTEQLTQSQDIFRPIFYYNWRSIQKKNKTQFHALHYECSPIWLNKQLRNSTWKTAEHVHSQKVLTHVQGRHPSLWSCRVDIGYVCGHEICNLLQGQQACGILPLLELFLYHWLQFFTESLIKGKLKQWDTLRHTTRLTITQTNFFCFVFIHCCKGRWVFSYITAWNRN